MRISDWSSDVCSSDLPWLIDHARRVRRRILANILWAFGYNAVALTLAASGLLQPVTAAGLMAGSSLVVVANSLLAGRALRDGSEIGRAACWERGGQSV